MALISCPECSKQYSDQAAACVHCGARNPNKMSPLRVVMLGVAVLVSIILFGIVLAEGNPRLAEMERDANAIRYCEDEYTRLKEDPRMTSGALGIAYGACEKLRSDYRARWGRAP